LASLRKCFLDGSLTRLLDPDKVLREKIPELVARGDLGFAAGEGPEGGFNRLWFNEKLFPEDIDFVYDVFVVRKDRAKALRDSMTVPGTAVAQAAPPGTGTPPPTLTLISPQPNEPPAGCGVSEAAGKTLLRVRGVVPPELWNRLGSKIISKLRSVGQLQARIELSVEVETSALASLEMEIQQVLSDLNLGGKVVVEKDRQ
jgi:hypothetical protein